MLCALANVCAQTAQLLDADSQQPIEGAYIFDIDNNNFLTSDADGNFELSGGKAFQIDHVAYPLTTISKDSIEANNYKIYLKSTGENLPDVTVTAYRFEENLSETGLQVKSINHLKIKELSTPTSVDLLAKSGQVYVQKSQMGGGSPVLRGFEANKVLLVVDGIRLNNAIYRGGHLQNALTIGQASIQNVDVILGPGSVMFGSDALGGVVSFTTFKPKLNTVEGSITARFSSAIQEKTTSFGLNLGNKKIANYTAFSYSDFGSLTMGQWRAHGDENWGLQPDYVQPSVNSDLSVKNDKPHQLKNTGYKQYDFLNKTLIPINENELILNLQYSTSSNIPRHDRLNDYSGDNLKFTQWEYGPQKRLLAAIHFNVKNSSLFYDKLNTTLAYQQVEESRIRRKFNNPTQANQIEQVQVITVNADAIKTLGSSKHKIQYGLDWAWNDVQSTAFERNVWANNDAETPITTRYPDGKNRTNAYAAYSLLRLNLSEKLKLKLGGRFAFFTLQSSYENQPFEGLNFNAFDYTTYGGTYYIGGSYNATESSRFNINISSGFRAPNLDDVGKIFDPFDGALVVPNGDISPEYINNFDAQWQQRFGKNVIVEIGGYYSLANNLIKRAKSTLLGQDSIAYEGDIVGIYANANAGKAYIAGGHAELNIIDNKGNFSTKHSIAYTRGHDITNDVPLGHIPPLYGRHEINHRYKRFNHTLSLEWNAKKPASQYSASEDKQNEAFNQLYTPAWFILNYQFKIELNKSFNLVAGIDNILDYHYLPFSSGISAPGRNFKLQIGASF